MNTLFHLELAHNTMQMMTTRTMAISKNSLDYVSFTKASVIQTDGKTSKVRWVVPNMVVLSFQKIENENPVCPFLCLSRPGFGQAPGTNVIKLFCRVICL
jgi:hypothetical protein